MHVESQRELSQSRIPALLLSMMRSPDERVLEASALAIRCLVNHNAAGLMAPPWGYEPWLKWCKRPTRVRLYV